MPPVKATCYTAPNYMNMVLFLHDGHSTSFATKPILELVLVSYLVINTTAQPTPTSRGKVACLNYLVAPQDTPNLYGQISV